MTRKMDFRKYRHTAEYEVAKANFDAGMDQDQLADYADNANDTAWERGLDRDLTNALFSEFVRRANVPDGWYC